MFSNKYIFIYASVMVVLVAILLATTATLLKPAQDNNVRIEKMQQILKSADVTVEAKDAIAAYDKYIVRELAVDSKGEIVAEFSNQKQVKGNIRPFDINLKVELKKYEKKEVALFPVFVFKGDKNDTLYIVSLYGKGLWGPVWGNISLKSDKNTISGVTFGHKGETPGLGAEISEQPFQNQFKEKQIFDETGKLTSITVVKGGVKNSTLDPKHGVDAISGGTITSNGTNDMLKDCLHIYEPFLKIK